MRKIIHPLWSNIFKSLFREKEGVDTELLGSIPIFKNLSRRELNIVSSILFERHYEAGESIFLMHQPGAAMFIIKTGEVEIQLEHDDDENLVLAKLEPGDFFGEIALLENSPRSATAYASTNTDLLAIFRTDLDKLIEKEPFIAAKIMKQLAIVVGVRLKETNKLFDQKLDVDEFIAQ